MIKALRRAIIAWSVDPISKRAMCWNLDFRILIFKALLFKNPFYSFVLIKLYTAYLRSGIIENG